MITDASSKMKTKTGLLALLAGLIVAVPPAHAQKTYKWVDDQGNITYQDKPPPKGVRVVDEYGEEAKSVKADPNQLAAQDSPVVFYSVPVCDACAHHLTPRSFAETKRSARCGSIHGLQCTG